MKFGEAIQSVFSKYVDFKGRARRSEFWYFYLFTVLVDMVINFISRASDKAGLVISIIFYLAILLPSLGVSVRRLHDIGKSGWYILIGLIPIVGTIILIVWWAKDSEPGANAYGANPKDNGNVVPETPAV